MPNYMHGYRGAVYDEDQYLPTPTLPYRGGGRYPTPRTADELRRGAGPLGPQPGEVAEVARVRQRVIQALEEINDRDYLDGLKSEIVWMLGYAIEAAKIVQPEHFEHYLQTLHHIGLTYEEDLW